MGLVHRQCDMSVRVQTVELQCIGRQPTIVKESYLSNYPLLSAVTAGTTVSEHHSIQHP